MSGPPRLAECVLQPAYAPAFLCLTKKNLYLGADPFLLRKPVVERFRYLAPGLAVAAQLQPSDMALAAAAGFTRVVNNRPDGEEAGQPNGDSMRQAAEAAGLGYHYLPVLSGSLTDANVTEFAQLAQTFDSPVLLYCRSGTRCAHLWALQQAQAGAQTLEQIVAAAATAGYDLQGLLPRMREQ